MLMHAGAPNENPTLYRGLASALRYYIWLPFIIWFDILKKKIIDFGRTYTDPYFIIILCWCILSFGELPTVSEHQIIQVYTRQILP